MVRSAKARAGAIEAAAGTGFLVATLGGVGQMPCLSGPDGQSRQEIRAIWTANCSHGQSVPLTGASCADGVVIEGSKSVDWVTSTGPGTTTS